MDKWKIQPPVFLRWLFPGTIWRFSTREKCVYLTFDDGPVPEVTPKVVALLNRYQAKATFFCVADNIRRFPEVYQMLQENGMQVGNHTYSHMKAWSNSVSAYFSDVEKGLEWNPTELFRPPHGQLYPWYVPRLKRTCRKIVMWDVLSMDYRADLSDGDVFEAVIKHVRPGSVIVFHDSLKAWPRLEKALPDILEYLSHEGYRMDLIAME
ncbi:polysaccharide deacetylase family protein [Geofilum rubicundum]|uniref:Polysaccharide deacetylase n=1 Tax=Geofilum rubicundum JCM 15548 TaxID=1236989 RepID=A0A0E9LYU8_9BACT|nr:polysaccharide deacetylase family protein [Geofilum rubicundum]GAO30040.1 polysaccharide deacetylase [Geofilum rubicundum JCM 15548]